MHLVSRFKRRLQINLAFISEAKEPLFKTDSPPLPKCGQYKCLKTNKQKPHTQQPTNPIRIGLIEDRLQKRSLHRSKSREAQTRRCKCQPDTQHHNSISWLRTAWLFNHAARFCWQTERCAVNYCFYADVEVRFLTSGFALTNHQRNILESAWSLAQNRIQHRKCKEISPPPFPLFIWLA